MSFSARYLDHFLVLDSINFLRSSYSLTGLFRDAKLSTFCAPPGVNYSLLGEDHCVETSATDLHNFLVFEEFHRRWYMPVFLIIESRKHGGAPSIKLRHSSERHTMLVACNHLGDVLDIAIEYWSPNDRRNVVVSKSQLA